MNVKMSFHDDMESILFQRLKTWGFSPEIHGDWHRTCTDYYGVLRRWVAPKPRKITYSKEFGDFPKSFQEGVSLLCKKIVRGHDTTSHLSRQFKNLDYSDKLLNDWGIHHFHLGTKIENDGFINRTNHLLYTKVTEEKIYFLKILDHKNFSDLKLLEIIHQNFSELLSDYRMDPQILGLSFVPDSNDIHKLRKAGIIGLIQLEDGAIYMPPGGGHATSGHSLHVVQQCNHIGNSLRLLEESVKEKVEQMLAKTSMETGIVFGDEIEFKLFIDDSANLYLVEPNYEITYVLGAWENIFS